MPVFEGDKLGEESLFALGRMNASSGIDVGSLKPGVDAGKSMSDGSLARLYFRLLVYLLPAPSLCGFPEIRPLSQGRW